MRNKANLGIHVLFLNVVVIIVSLFSSCAGETNIIDGNNSKLLNFSVSVPSWKNNDSMFSSKDSRATPITETSLGTSNTFNLIADENDGNGNYSTLIDNKPVSYSNNLWKTKTDYYWSGTSSKTINFYAYYSTSAIKGILNHTAGSAPTLTYTVPDDAANQHDIIVATKSLTEDANSAVDLSFNHIFAAVKFSVGTNGLPSGTIASISISGINNSGTYTFGSGWTLGSTTSTFTVSPSTTITGAAGANITSDAFTMMMIPQTFSSATVTLTYSNGTAFSQTISSGTWAAGNTYTYNLSKTVIYDYDYTGSVQTFKAPYTGTYKLEVWGAGSQSARNASGAIMTEGKGGYATGTINLSSGTIIYICIGGVGNSGSGNNGGAGGYNGGGNGGSGGSSTGGSGGGGATHMAKTPGILSGLSNNRSSILIIAGGSGGSAGNGTAGSGGGISGGSTSSAGWSASGISSVTISGGTQINGYAFGQGQNASSKVGTGGNAGPEGNGGGGGGFYGGYAYIATGDGSCCGGSGGSGYIGGVNNGTTTNGIRSGNGYARITFVSAN